MGRRTLSPDEARAMSRRASARRETPADWTSADAYRAYLQDADGGRAPYRALAVQGDDEFSTPDTTPTYLERTSWEA